MCKKRSLLLTASAALALGVSVSAFAQIPNDAVRVGLTFCPDGNGQSDCTDGFEFDNWDWDPDNSLGQGAIPNVVGTESVNYIHGSLANFRLLDTILTNDGGLNDAYEVTFVASFPVTTTGVNPSEVPPPFNATAELRESPSGFFEVWVSDPNHVSLSGSGYNDGIRILAGNFIDSFGTFTVRSFNSDDVAANPPLDQLAEDNWSDTGTLEGVGSTVAEIEVTFVNLDYFVLAANTELRYLRYNTDQNAPYSRSNPSACFTGDPAAPDDCPSDGTPARTGVGNEGAAGVVPIVGPLNGVDTGDPNFTPPLDFLVETDARNEFFGEVIPPPPGGGFKTYFAKQRAGSGDRVPVTTVQVTDQFQNRSYEAFLLHELWNPAVKNSPVEDPPLPDTHKTCYKVRPAPGQDSFIPPTVDIVTENFGEDSFRLGQPWELCLPAQKTVLPDGVSQGSTTGNHYLCYTAASAPQDVDVTLDDQFGREVAVVTKLEQFCTPVGKNDPDFVPPVEDPAIPETWSHLACYSIVEESGPELPIDVNVVDQFTGTEGVTQTVERPRQWCEPAFKANVTPRG